MKAARTFLKRMAAAVVLGAGALLAGTANAAIVECGGASGIRVVTVDPALAGGLCYTQTGNLQNADIAALGLSVIEWDVAPNGKTTGALQYTIEGKEYGTWAINSGLWGTWNHLYLAFHFGGAGDTSESNPDSFVVELGKLGSSGEWSLGPETAKLTGLSNIYLLGKEPCTVNCGGNQEEVPEPATLVLAGLALLALAALRRRRS